jgi:hypothetical protein
VTKILKEEFVLAFLFVYRHLEAVRSCGGVDEGTGVGGNDESVG